MSRLRVRRWAILLLTIGLVAAVPVGASAQTQADVDKAERNRKIAEASKTQAYQDYTTVTAQLDDAVTKYEKLWAEREELSYRIQRMETAAAFYEEEADELEERARDIVIDAYTSGQRNLVGSAFTASSIQDLVTSQALIGRATERELASLDNLDAVSRQADRASAELDIRRADVAANQDAAAIVVEDISELQKTQATILAKADDSLHAAIDTYNREINEKRVEDARIKRQKAEKSASRPGAAGGTPPATTPGFICPVLGGASFIDSWGFPRSGGRRHKGVDMFATRGTPVVAVVDGRIKFSSNSLGGRSTHLYSDNGTVYYYTHLDGHPGNISSGQRVAKGTVVGFVGNSGNARYTSPQNHFEIRPNGRAVNPYPTVRSAC
ncbi:MAG: peptidoglycan DD-metalloendopeptidase family protein [Actinomycetia bacterium]|nr:peptidoglycan DD-metalloendopeptidase family protein [Actinomycetes bacterium]